MQQMVINGTDPRFLFVFQIEAIWKGQILARYLEGRVQNSSLVVCLLLPETPMQTSGHKGQSNLKSVDA